MGNNSSKLKSLNFFLCFISVLLADEVLFLGLIFFFGFINSCIFIFLLLLGFGIRLTFFLFSSLLLSFFSFFDNFSFALFFLSFIFLSFMLLALFFFYKSIYINHNLILVNDKNYHKESMLYFSLSLFF